MNTKKALDHTEVFESVFSSHFFFFIGIKTNQALSLYELLPAAFFQSEIGEHVATDINSLRENK